MKTSIAVSLFAFVLTGAANAQTIAPDPTRLPGDTPPPPLAIMLRPPSGRPLPPPDTTPGVPAALALEAARAAIDTCAAQGLRVGVALTNSAGHLRVALTTDGATSGVIYGAVQKDLAAMAFKAPTSDVQAQLRADPATAARVLPNMEVRPGAVPILVGGKVLGAIAVDGATAQQDEVCAHAGVDMIMDRLNNGQ
jgi:uncharacterized protein GlcG (DUF336 family)